MNMKQHQLKIFFAITLIFSAGLAAIATAIGNTDMTILTVFSPSLAAIAITAWVSGRPGIKQLLIGQSSNKVSFGWVAIAIFSIPLIAVIAIAVYSFFGGPPLALRSTTIFPQIILIFLISFGEEYGWRGFALPLLQEKFSALNASLILGLVWGIWHFPGYLIGVGVPLYMPFIMFLLWVIAATILMTWVHNHTQNVLMAVLMHSAANATFNYLPLLPEFVGQLTSFSVFLVVLLAVTIFVIFRFGPKRLMRNFAV